MDLFPIEAEDQKLIEAARDVIQRNYTGELHSVGAAVRTRVGQGVRRRQPGPRSGFGSCAESITLGIAISQGERDFKTIVAVGGWSVYPVIPPCGNCRELLSEYLPDGWVILEQEGKYVKARGEGFITGGVEKPVSKRVVRKK